MPPCHIDAENYFDVLIIGAGPCALALAARLAEKHPAALYSDIEHARLAWLRRRGRFKQNKGRKRTLVDSAAKIADADSAVERIVVLDASSDRWLSRWRTSFEQLEIPYLRSPLHFHLAPDDNDAFRCFAWNKDDQTRPVSYIDRPRKSRRALSTAEKQINERDRRDYRTPSNELFLAFCETLVARYKLGNRVKQARVTDIQYGEDILHLNDGSGRHTGFCIDVEGGSRYGARAVVVACGGTSCPMIPGPFAGLAHGLEGPGWSHSARFYEPEVIFPPPSLAAQSCHNHMAVIGGGLTSAQIVDLALRRGIPHVTLVCRSRLKVRTFDVGIEWVAKFSSTFKATFWQSDDFKERLDMIRLARSGGSMTPAMNAILQKHVAAGRLTILTESIVDKATYEGGIWQLTLKHSHSGSIRTLDDVDHVVLATGSHLDLGSLPFARSLIAKGIVHDELGFPALNEDLQTVGADQQVTAPLFFIGARSALQLGPGGFNLSGAREGAERVAHRLAELHIFEGGMHDIDSREALAALSVNHFEPLNDL